MLARRMTWQEESDQMPEEGPSGQVPEDTDGEDSRDEAEEGAGTPGEEGQDDESQASGNPKSAG
jgi:hypothetical protein